MVSGARSTKFLVRVVRQDINCPFSLSDDDLGNFNIVEAI
jgi:hypothetical protein